MPRSNAYLRQMERATHQPEDGQHTPPSLTFESVTFSDGTKLDVGPTDIVVFVGPNNAGKSAALRELVLPNFDAAHRYVIKEAPFRKSGSADDLRRMLRETGNEQGRGVDLHYGGLGYNIQDRRIKTWDSNPREMLGPFARSVATQDRITASNQVGAYDVVASHPTTPIQLLFSNKAVEQRLSGYFRRAFGKDLIFFNGGSQWMLYVGKRPLRSDDEESTDRSYLEKILKDAVPLHEQGDGMRSFATCILGLLTATSTMLLLDEPEAFLHPPQARLLGEFIAKERPKASQLFVATHSQDVLQALLSSAPDNLRVIRMQRDGGVNRVKELDKAKAKQISADPIMNYSSVLSGVFHERVVICEADADCMFYGAILDLPAVHGERQPDVLFIHANGKHRIATLASALRGLDVPVDVIADMDVLNDLTVMESLVSALGGDWKNLQADAAQTKMAVEQHKPWLNAGEVAKGIRAELDKCADDGEFPRSAKQAIQAIFRKASPWDAIKDAGEQALPQGEPTTRWRRLWDTCGKMGLWIVPVGQLENFDKSFGGHGPRWVQQVLEQRDLASAPELEGARRFIKRIWSRIAPQR